MCTDTSVKIFYQLMFFDNECSIIVFTENVAALKRVWFVGDDSLCEFFISFKSMRLQAERNSTDLPYLFANYNVDAFHAPQHSNVRAFLARVINALSHHT